MARFSNTAGERVVQLHPVLVLGAAFALLAAALPGTADPDPPGEGQGAPEGGYIRRADGTTIEVAAAAERRSEPTASDPAEDLEAELERRVFELTNGERRRYGREPLQADETLAVLARGHSADMLRRGYVSHVNPEGQTPADRVAVGHRRLIGQISENLWTGSGLLDEDPALLARKIVDGWMASPGHRENLLRKDCTHLGVGVAREEGEVRATQSFATVWAWLDRPLPLRVSRAALPELLMRPFGSHVTATRFDAAAAGSGKPAMDPVPITARRLEVPPGRYRLRFYFPKKAGAFEFWIIAGPEIIAE